MDHVINLIRTIHYCIRTEEAYYPKMAKGLAGPAGVHRILEVLEEKGCIGSTAEK